MAEGRPHGIDKQRIRHQMGSTVVNSKPMKKGYIGDVHRVQLSDGRTIAVKLSKTSLWVEYIMLDYLQRESPIPVPEVFDVSRDMMIMEFIPGRKIDSTEAEKSLARRLAELHEVEGDAFGFTCDTLAGTLRQPNPWMDSWIEFFRSQRMLYAARKAKHDDWFTQDLFNRVLALSENLNEYLPASPRPSLVHGDIHQHNAISRGGEIVAFIDPALYYAHAEIDLAYISFEADFGSSFFEEYFDYSHLKVEEFEARLPVYKTYLILARSLVVSDSSYGDSLSTTLESMGY